MNLYKITNHINKLGIDVRRYPTALLRNRIKLLKSFDITLVFDVGANIGQYGEEMRRIGYKDQLVSFEPIKEPYQKLEAAAQNDRKWQTVAIALGDFDGETEINVAGNLASSSIRTINERHIEAKPITATVRTELIKVAKLDSIIDDYTDGKENIFVKIDTQGFEKNVLEGAVNSFDRIRGFQLELSLVELYEGECLFLEMIQYLQGFGYEIYSLEPNFWNVETGQLYQADALFFRKDG